MTESQVSEQFLEEEEILEHTQAREQHLNLSTLHTFQKI